MGNGKEGEGTGPRHSRCLWVALPLGITSQCRGRVPALESSNLLQPRSHPSLAAARALQCMDLFLFKDLGMKISVYIEVYIFYLIAVPWLLRGHGTQGNIPVVWYQRLDAHQPLGVGSSLECPWKGCCH